MTQGLIGIDIGTTGAKVALFSTSGQLLASEYNTYETYYPQTDHVEQRPDDWVEATISGLRAVLQDSGFSPSQIVGISFSGQMMGQIPMSRDGELLLKQVPIWADQRAKPQAERFLRDFGGHEAYYNITFQGHPVHMTSTFRMMWFAEHDPELVERAFIWLHAKEYVLYRLTGNFATDPTDQCLGGAFDLKEGRHSTDVLKCAGFRSDQFPEMMESTEIAGKITPEISELTGLVEGTPVVMGAGDGPCAAAGSAAVSEGDAYFYLGSALWGGTIEPRPFGDFDSRMICYRHMVPDLYHSQYVSFTGAIGQQWIIDTAYSECDADQAFERAWEEARAIDEDAALPVFLPFLRPGGAPHQHGNASGVFHGIRIEHKRAHLFKAVVLGIANSLNILYNDVARVTGRNINELTIVGGGARNPIIMQAISSGLGIPVQLLGNQESNCLGAALCAGLGMGVWSDVGSAKSNGIFQAQQRFEPDETQREKVQAAQRKFEETLRIAHQLWDLQ